MFAWFVYGGLVLQALLIVLTLIVKLPASVAVAIERAIELYFVVSVALFWTHCAKPALLYQRASRAVYRLVLGVSMLAMVGWSLRFISDVVGQPSPLPLRLVSGVLWFLVAGIGWPRYSVLNNLVQTIGLLSADERMGAELRRARTKVDAAHRRWATAYQAGDVQRQRLTRVATARACDEVIHRLDAQPAPREHWDRARASARVYFVALQEAAMGVGRDNPDSKTQHTNAEIAQLGADASRAWQTAFEIRGVERGPVG